MQIKRTDEQVLVCAIHGYLEGTVVQQVQRVQLPSFISRHLKICGIRFGTVLLNGSRKASYCISQFAIQTEADQRTWWNKVRARVLSFPENVRERKSDGC